MRIIKLGASITASNDKDAAALRARLKESGTLLVNVMSSAGSGKTTLLSRLICDLPDFDIGVMEADIESDVDAKKIEALGATAIQVHTGGMCHMDAGMTTVAFDEMGGTHDLVFLENVGNLICPAEYDTGAGCNLMILSVPEGDDKPLKYPLMFRESDVLVITKTDALTILILIWTAVSNARGSSTRRSPCFPSAQKRARGCSRWKPGCVKRSTNGETNT